MNEAVRVLEAAIAQRESANQQEHLNKELFERQIVELRLALGMIPNEDQEHCITFRATAKDQKDGSTAVWTDGVSLDSDNQRNCAYRLLDGADYKVILMLV